MKLNKINFDTVAISLSWCKLIGLLKLHVIMILYSSQTPFIPKNSLNNLSLFITSKFSPFSSVFLFIIYYYYHCFLNEVLVLCNLIPLRHGLSWPHVFVFSLIHCEGEIRFNGDKFVLWFGIFFPHCFVDAIVVYYVSWWKLHIGRLGSGIT